MGDGAGWFYAMDRATGRVRWRSRAAAPVMSSATVAGKLVIFGSDDGGVYALRTGDEPIRRVVYWSPDLAKAASYRGAEDLAAYFRDRGYEQADEDGVAALMQRVVEGDKGPRGGAGSVVVFALDHLPPVLLKPVGGVPLLRAYLDAGGKVVWPGIPPRIWPRDPATGDAGGLDRIRWDAPTDLLGVDFGATMFNLRSARTTAEGDRWGLEGRWRARWGIEPSEPTRVLALDDFGHAATWVEEYGGGPGTGFVMAPGVPLDMVYRLAEARPPR